MKENEKDVTVIIPTYNRAHILERVIESYFQSDVKEVIFMGFLKAPLAVNILVQMLVGSRLYSSCEIMCSAS